VLFNASPQPSPKERELDEFFYILSQFKMPHHLSIRWIKEGSLMICFKIIYLNASPQPSPKEKELDSGFL
jgi:hypothetical protein